MSSDYFFIAFIPIIFAQIIARVYLLKYLDLPARFKGAPWYVQLSFNSGLVKLFDLKETVLFYLIGFIGFTVVFVMSIDQFIFRSLVILLFFLGIWLFWKAMVWMDENDQWGTRKANEDRRSTFQILTKDSFLLFNSVGVFLLIFIIGIFQIDEYVRGKGYEAGVKEAREQMRQDSIRAFENKE